LLFSIFHTPAISAPHNPHGDKGVFLVATEQLHGTSFQEAVILLTHYSARGVTGLTINRPTDIPLSEALPNIHQFNQHTEPLYLGGPVSTNAIFVLVRTKQPRKSMHHIINDIYFSTGNNAFGGPLSGTVRTYAGYAGWTAHQLQNEISRGDWLVIQTEPAIVFEQDPSRLWNRLMKTWSGDWI
jgi:putative transcriptional regulator